MGALQKGNDGLSEQVPAIPSIHFSRPGCASRLPAHAPWEGAGRDEKVGVADAGPAPRVSSRAGALGFY